MSEPILTFVRRSLTINKKLTIHDFQEKKDNLYKYKRCEKL